MRFGPTKPVGLAWLGTRIAVHAAYDITPVNETPWYEGREKLNLDAEDWLQSSSFPCASKDVLIYVACSKSLEQRDPPVARFLSRMELDPAVVNQWILKIGRDKMDPRDVAEEWVENNMDTENKWIQ